MKIIDDPNKIFNNQARSFAKAFTEQKISTYSKDKIIPGLKELLKAIQNEYTNLGIDNISIQIAGSKLDLKPFLNL